MRIFDCKKPVLGAINGAAVGIGATMTLSMDARLASETARYGFVFARRGIVPEAASSWFLPRLVGIQNAVDWCYSGRLIDAAQEAHDKGLVQSVHAPGDLVDAAIAKARELTDHSAPVSVALTRHMLWRDARRAAPDERAPLGTAARSLRADAAPMPPRACRASSKSAPRTSPSGVANDYPWFAEFEDTPPYS